jgi:branched-chain amino acid aminotransferase
MPPARPARRTADFVWLNGELVPWDEATIHVTSMGASGGVSVFEGIKAHTSPDGKQLYVFALAAHLRRLAESMKMMRMACPWSEEDLFTGTLELLRRNRTAEDVYIRPVAYFSGLDFLTFADELNEAPEVLIWTRPFVSRLGTKRVIACQVSSWTRITDNQMPPRIKCMSNYQNNRLAALEARVNGYDSAILLGPDGKVAEGPGACLFIVRDGVALTPPVTGGILESVTRGVVKRLLSEVLDVPVVERVIDRTELYVAQEAFFCGTGAEIQPIGSIDRLPVGDGGVGPITRRLDLLYRDVVRGADARFSEWRTLV